MEVQKKGSTDAEKSRKVKVTAKDKELNPEDYSAMLDQIDKEGPVKGIGVRFGLEDFDPKETNKKWDRFDAITDNTKIEKKIEEKKEAELKVAHPFRIPLTITILIDTNIAMTSATKRLLQKKKKCDLPE